MSVVTPPPPLADMTTPRTPEEQAALICAAKANAVLHRVRVQQDEELRLASM